MIEKKLEEEKEKEEEEEMTVILLRKGGRTCVHACVQSRLNCRSAEILAPSRRDKKEILIITRERAYHAYTDATYKYIYI